MNNVKEVPPIIIAYMAYWEIVGSEIREMQNLTVLPDKYDGTVETSREMTYAELDCFAWQVRWHGGNL